MPSIAIDNLADPRVAIFHAVSDPDHLRRTGHFIAEGRLVVERLVGVTQARRAVSSPYPPYEIEALLLSDAAHDALAPALASIPEIPVYVCTAAAFASLGGFNLHRGALAVARRPSLPAIAGLVSGARRVVVLENVGNPDNIGGIFRTAAAFGVEAVLLSPGCGDPLYRKAIRTSMAATLSMPYAVMSDWPAGLQQLRLYGFSLVALTPRANARPLNAWASQLQGDNATRGDSPRLAVLFGSEGPGLTVAAVDLADVCLRIPMVEAVDSLNVTVACGIALSHLLPVPVS